MGKNEIAEFDENIIRDRIYSIRGFQVMLDRDLAELYGVETRTLKQAVKRNIKKFPEDFMYELTKNEISYMVSQNVIPSKQILGGSLPFAFTQEGVAMLSSILKSLTATNISIKIMRAFVSMRKFIQSNGQLFQRMDNLEVKLIETDKKVEKIIDAMSSGDFKPKQGIFYENQIFDAYKFVSDLFRSAEKFILIIDNYIDDSVLVHLTKVSKEVKVKILTKVISDQLSLDVKKFNSQYVPIEVVSFTHAHDRFIIIDNRDVYHIGASLKDLGKKWFAFSKIEKSDMEILRKLEKY